MQKSVEVYEDIIEDLKKYRKELKISQKELAADIGISRGHLNQIENGKREASEKMLQKIYFALEAKDKCLEPVEIILDYVRVRIPTMDIKFVAETIMRMKLKYFLYEDWGFYGYKGQYVMGNIVLMTSPKKENGILIEMKGKGCRQFESYLEAQRRTWFDFFREIQKARGVFKRVDIAVNDKYGILDVIALEKKADNGEMISYFKKFEHHTSGFFSEQIDQHKSEMGNTLYLGSKKSDIYFCIYEKDYEQFVKNGTAYLDATVKNRFEIRLKDDRAQLAVEDLTTYEDISKTAFGIINNYVKFVDKGKSKKQDWKINATWGRFIGMEERVLKLTVKPEPYTIEQTENWLMNKVAPSMKMVNELNKLKGKDFVQDMLDSARLSERQKKIIEQEKSNIEDIIK